MANVPRTIVADHLRLPRKLPDRPRLSRLQTTAQTRPVVKENPAHGREALQEEELVDPVAGRGAPVGVIGGARLGYMPSPVYHGGAGFRGAAETVYRRGMADPHRHPPGVLNRHYLLPPVRQNALGSRIVTALFQRPSSSFGTIQAIARRIIVQVPGPYDVTPRNPFRGTDVGRRANPPPAGLFGVIPSVIDRWYSFRTGYGTEQAKGQVVWHRTASRGGMTAGSTQSARYRMRAAHKYRLTQAVTPGVNPAVDVAGELVD